MEKVKVKNHISGQKKTIIHLHKCSTLGVMVLIKIIMMVQMIMTIIITTLVVGA